MNKMTILKKINVSIGMLGSGEDISTTKSLLTKDQH